MVNSVQNANNNSVRPQASAKKNNTGSILLGAGVGALAIGSVGYAIAKRSSKNMQKNGDTFEKTSDKVKNMDFGFGKLGDIIKNLKKSKEPNSEKTQKTMNKLLSKTFSLSEEETKNIKMTDDGLEIPMGTAKKMFERHGTADYQIENDKMKLSYKQMKDVASSEKKKQKEEKRGDGVFFDGFVCDALEILLYALIGS